MTNNQAIRQETTQEIAKLTVNYMSVWMKAWENAEEAAVELVVALFAPDKVYHATPFNEGVGHERIRTYESMIRTQQNGKGSVEFLGVAESLGVFRWRIEYEVVPKKDWASRLPQKVIDSPEWESYRLINVTVQGGIRALVN